MLFNSYIFIFLFLPVTVGAYYTLRHAQLTREAMFMLIFASFFFITRGGILNTFFFYWC